MSIYYKFKNELELKSLPCEGSSMTVHNLKVAIVLMEHKSSRTRFDLDILNTDGQVMDKDYDEVQRSSRVIVRRKPLEGSLKQKTWLELNEEDAISKVCEESAAMYDPKHWVNKPPARNYPPPPNYKCRKCNVAGHWVADCMLKPGDVVHKPTTGIPRTLLTLATKDTPGARVGHNGLYMVTEIEKQAYLNPKKEKPIWAVDDEPAKYEPETHPKELLCLVCKDLMVDCVRMPVCACPFCDNCARMSLLESDENACPTCGTKDNYMDHIQPCEELRAQVYEYRNPSAKKRRISAASSLSGDSSSSSAASKASNSDSAPAASPSVASKAPSGNASPVASPSVASKAPSGTSSPVGSPSASPEKKPIEVVAVSRSERRYYDRNHNEWPERRSLHRSRDREYERSSYRSHRSRRSAYSSSSRRRDECCSYYHEEERSCYRHSSRRRSHERSREGHEEERSFYRHSSRRRSHKRSREDEERRYSKKSRR